MIWEGPSAQYWDPPESHESEKCGCESCHEIHTESVEGVFDNAKEGFECCQNQIETWIADGYVCPDRPDSHGFDSDEIYKKECPQCKKETEEFRKATIELRELLAPETQVHLGKWGMFFPKGMGKVENE